MKYTLSRVALAALIVSALAPATVGVAADKSEIDDVPVIVITEEPDTNRSKKGWLAEQLAVTAFGDSLQYWQAASENEGTMSADTKNNLADIGKGYTENNLPKLGELDDFALEESTDSSDSAFYRIGDIYTPTAEATKTVKGVFTTYHEKTADVTVYTGPDQSRLVDNQLRGQGATYYYPTGAITNIHTTDKSMNSVRDIGVGSTRMEMIFAYGSPNAMWRDQSNESYIFLYEGYDEKSWNKKEEFSSLVANTNNNSQSTNTIEKGKSYVAFTIKNNNIESIDIIDGQVWSRFGLPKTTMYDFKAGALTEDDFVLRGLKLNEKFKNDSNSEWKTQGMLFGSSFIGYNEYGVSVDNASLINRVLLNVYTPTRRGIAMGDTKYLLLFTYGMPTRIVESTTENGTATVYEYKNPRSSNSYLQFALDDKNQYIKSVMLSDRPVK